MEILTKALLKLQGKFLKFFKNGKSNRQNLKCKHCCYSIGLSTRGDFL